MCLDVPILLKMLKINVQAKRQIKSSGSATITTRSQPRHQEKEEKDKTWRMQGRYINAREAYRPVLSFLRSEVLPMLNRT